MRLGKKEKKYLTMLALGAILLMVLAYSGLIPLAIVANYQGPQAQFYGVVYDGKTWSQENPRGNRFDTMMRWDPDDPYYGMGDLIGEETGMFLPPEDTSVAWTTSQQVYDSGSETEKTVYIPTSWYSGWKYFKNPVATYEWKIKDDNGITHYYKMEEWVMYWFFAIRYNWDSFDAWKDNTEAFHGWGCSKSPVRFHNVEVWFRIDLNRIKAYFQGANESFFGIAKLVVKNVYKDGMHPEQIDVNPASSGSLLPMYLAPFGEKPKQPPTPEEYRGRLLNPEVFTKTVYTYIMLNDFGDQIHTDNLCAVDKIVGDVVVYQIEVHIFVVGDWEVKNVQQVPQDYGEHAKVQTVPTLADSIGAFFTNPFTIAGLGILGMVALVILLAIYAPGVLLVIASAIGRARKK